MHFLEVCNSTMEEAQNLAQSGAAHGTGVCALEQTHGRGRLHRAWYSPKGTGLYVTFVLRQYLDSPCLPLNVAVWVLKSLQKLIPEERLGLKWPNDVLWRGKKLAGILLQQHVQAKQTYVLAGIGINLLPSTQVCQLSAASAMPPDVQQRYIGLGEVIAWPLEPLRLALLAALQDGMAVTLGGEQAAILSYWQAHDVMKGHTITLGNNAAAGPVASGTLGQMNGELSSEVPTLTGEAMGIDEGGNYLVRTTAGIQRFKSGEIAW